MSLNRQKSTLKNWTSLPLSKDLANQTGTFTFIAQRQTQHRPQTKSNARFYSRWQAFMLSTLSQEKLENFEKNSFSFYGAIPTPSGKEVTSDNQPTTTSGTRSSRSHPISPPSCLTSTSITNTFTKSTQLMNSTKL